MHSSRVQMLTFGSLVLSPLPLRSTRTGKISEQKTFRLAAHLHRESLNDETATQLRNGLLSWAIRLVARAEGPLVVRKLCSALVAYFLRPSVVWDHCIRHLLCCFSTSDVITAGGLSQQASIEQIVRQLQPPQITCCLWFVSMLVEEVGKMSAKSIQTYG